MEERRPSVVRAVLPCPVVVPQRHGFRRTGAVGTGAVVPLKIVYRDRACPPVGNRPQRVVRAATSSSSLTPGAPPAGQIARLGMRPGTHVRVVAEQPPEVEGSIAGRLTSWPDVAWEDFERASQLAQAELDRS